MAGKPGFFKRIKLAVSGLFRKDTKEILPLEPELPEVSPSSGLDAIDAEFERLYPGCSSITLRPEKPWREGGSEPLDLLRIFDAGDCWHLVSYGLTELYGKETRDMKKSGFGAEFSLRLGKSGGDDREDLVFLRFMLQGLARKVHEQREMFAPWSYISIGRGIDSKGESGLTGFITLPDTLAQSLDTPNGRVDFLELVGVTEAELNVLAAGELSVEALYHSLSSDITELNRVSTC